MTFDFYYKAQKILDRMRIAHDKGKGIRLSHEDLEILYIAKIGELWEDEREDLPKGDLKLNESDIQRENI